MRTAIEIDLINRYQAAFGYVANITLGSTVDLATKIALFEANKAIVKSNLSVYERGDATFANIELHNAKTDTHIKFGITEKNELLEGVIAPPPMVSFSRSKNIKTTVIDNSDYEVIESFGVQNWNISLEGILIDIDYHWYPSELVKEINKLFEVNDTYKVIGQVFEDLKITEIYFEDLSELSFVEGYNDTLKFKLKAKSIKPAEFFI